MVPNGRPEHDAAALLKARLRLLERLGLALLLLMAIVPRVRDLSTTFDREFDGFQGSCFALFTVNLERLGIGAYGGYPIFNVDLPTDPETQGFVYANHPPLVPWLCLASLRLFGPEGWDSAWGEGQPPEGIEGTLRLPFFVLHMAGLLALWWAARQGDGPQVALLTLAFAAVLPVSILYAGLVNYENPCLPFVLLGAGFHVRWLRSARPRDLGAAAAALFVGSAVTFTPVFFLPGLVLQALWHRGWRRALLAAAVLGGAALLPALLHGAWVKVALPGLVSDAVGVRAKTLLAPLLDGSAPLHAWISRQWTRMAFFFTLPVLLTACAGAAVAITAALRSRRERPEPIETRRVSLAVPLALGGFLTLFAFYTHTWDGDGARNGQTMFLLNVVPAAALLAARALDGLTRPLARLRGGFAPLVAIVALLGLPAVSRANAIRHDWRDPGPRDDPSLTSGPETPLPATRGREIAEVLPAGSIGLFPFGMSFGPAVSYYAWRTLLGVDERLWDLRLMMIDNELGMADAPRYILLPVDPPPNVRAFVQRHRANLAAKFGQPLAASEAWEIWPPEP